MARISKFFSFEICKFFSEEFDQKFKSFNLEYQKKDSLILDQQNLIGERNKNIKSLTERVKALEKKLEQESNPKDLAIRQLKKELEIKSAQIAQLSYQLHNASRANKLANAVETTVGLCGATHRKTLRHIL